MGKGGGDTVKNAKEQRQIGIDFGMNYTVVAASDGSSSKPYLVSLSGISEDIPVPGCIPVVTLVPSVIGYHLDGSTSIGEETVSQCKEISATLRQLVYYLCEESPVRVHTGDDRQVSYQQAGRDFLSEIIDRVVGDKDKSGTKIIVTRPLDAPLRYREWIAGLNGSSGVWNIASIDIANAAVKGCRLPFREGKLYVLIDFRPESFDVAVVVPEPDATESSGFSSRVIGRATAGFGGVSSDLWIASEIISGKGTYIPENRLREMQSCLIRECQRARLRLSYVNETTVEIRNPWNGTTSAHALSRIELERIYCGHNLFTTAERTISRALSAALTLGFDRNDITAVIMIGELSTVHAFQEVVRRQFPERLVECENPLGVAALGATLDARTLEDDRIRSDYALNYRDPASGDQRYRFLVRSGLRFPSAGEVARILISASFDGQVYLGIPLCRIQRETGNALGTGIELIGNPGGGLRLAGPALDCRSGGKPVHVNKTEPTYLVASPPARKGEARFELTFTVDKQGYLCVTARDLMTGALVKESARVHWLE